MPVAILPSGEWTPDSPDLGSTGITVAENVLPLTPTSYGPLPAVEIVPNVSALPGKPLGVYAFKDRDGSNHLFAGTSDKIYRLSTGDTAWVDVSNSSRTYHVTDFNAWSAIGFENAVLFSNGVDPIQIYDFDQNATTFTDLSDQAPLASFIATTGNFVLTANVTEGGDSVHYQYRVHWGVDGVANGAPYSWPDPGSDEAQQTQSDFNDIRSDLGAITGIVAGLQNALFVVFLAHAAFWCTYQVAPVVFQFTQAQGAIGCPYPGSICSNRGIAYYIGQDGGFYQLDGANIAPIGAQKVDRWFAADANPMWLYNIQSAADPSGKYVYWSYASTSSTDGTHDSLLIYNWSLSRFSYARVSLQWLARGLTRGLSIDSTELNDFYGNTIDGPVQVSFDSPIWVGGRLQLIGIDAAGHMVTFSGSPMAATIETQEVQPAEFADASQQQEIQTGRRSRVTAARPILDGDLGDDDMPTIAIGSRSRLQDAVSWGSAKGLNWDGLSPQRRDNRYFRARVAIPAGADWRHFQGVELMYAPSTRR
jgi:hypothetical protein